ncbi:MAG: serine--tRNA ligase [Candidatus Pacebacteria bacterium]|nr:serine--tRNA ligase [Candidatus Paceibacterota bacterium]MDD5357416.1 serine--tRNA ligase [Candidatus Paceibacterota bacterium]
MLDIKFIRENKDLIALAAKKKFVAFDVEELLATDDLRKMKLQSVEKKRTEQNVVSDKVASAKDPAERDAMIFEMRKFKADMNKEETELEEIMKKWRSLMLLVPNIPDMTVPDGESDVGNMEVKKWGSLPEFDFTPKNHIELMENLGMVDLVRGAKVAGFRGYFLKDAGVKLSFAIWNYALDFFSKKGFSPMIVPSLVRRENLLGTGFLPQGEEDLYKTQDGDFLAGTGEVATMGYHSDEILPMEDLPKKFLAFSPCFRREAGSHSKDVKGLIRVHEFYKFEQVILCEASHETSVRFHEELTRNTEEFIESLGIPYHRVINCGGDLGLGQVKKYDLELWVPLEKKYREIASASYFHDFQTRRLNIRYKDTDGKMKFAHSLNNTAIPTPRILVSLVENFQQGDGSIAIPEVLQPYFGDSMIAPKKR